MNVNFYFVVFVFRNFAFRVIFFIILIMVSRFFRYQSFLVSLVIAFLGVVSTWDVSFALSTPERGYFRYFLGLEKNHIDVYGESDGEQFGTVFASGDFNGDDNSDLIVGSPFFSSKNKAWHGKATLIYGETDSVFSDQSERASFYGEDAQDSLGNAFAVGDFNGDRMDDIAMAAYDASAGSLKKVGKVYIWFGKGTNYRDAIDLSKVYSPITLIGKDSYEHFGFALDAFDVDHDGVDDLLIGAPGASESSFKNIGKVYVFYGEKQFPSRYVNNYGLNSPKTIYIGENENDRFGATLTHGDLNGDSVTDLIVGSYLASAPRRPEAGKVSIFFGKDVSSEFSRTVTTFSKPGVKIYGPRANVWLGFSLATGDFNDDSVSDLAMGAFMFPSKIKTGEVFVLYGKADLRKNPVIDLRETEADFHIVGDQSENLLGASIVIADFDGDKKNDLILGAPGVSNTESQEPGEVYLFSSRHFFGKTRIDLKEDFPDLRIIGTHPDDWLGGAMISADFNHDRISDLVVGSPYSHDKGAKSAGKVSVIFGSKKPLGTYVEHRKFEASNILPRGKFLAEVLEIFDLKNRQAQYLESCRNNPDFCFFVFSAQSRFNDIRFSPNIILYPDVYPAHPYYDAIVTGTMLGLLEGYTGEPESPFRPDQPITRIEALKVILGAAKLLDWKDRSELKNELGGEPFLQAQATPFRDVDARISHMWWYPRYVNFAYLTNIIPDKNLFHPDDLVTYQEFLQMVQRTRELSESSVSSQP